MHKFVDELNEPCPETRQPAEVSSKSVPVIQLTESDMLNFTEVMDEQYRNLGRQFPFITVAK